MRSDGNGGWLTKIGARYYHLTEQWVDDMTRHQAKPKGLDPLPFNRLRWYITHGTAEQVEEAFHDTRRQIGQAPAKSNRQGPTPELAEFIKEQRGKRGKQDR